ncbi:DUF1835 domain-containing protein [Robertmurraya kyonggiensis]|uniref:DUF1835 domain-containing protein n=1 Tax=Robertmurraya kyonggiensis TaxID=1037680 RepID=A0A4U1D9Y9_9BACI|nr:DUF1835 domain-containing protein [Robertmurraya kyonggiensis]TKC18938.1 DUF1835 domain-containing protein [Robertmurraya kyonggiensis]
MIFIKVKVNYPFIYFYNEPNVVFVYQIKTSQYLTLTDMNEVGEWATYELKDAGEFEKFNHEEYLPLEGRGYFVNQEGLSVMVKAINKVIQKNRVVIESIPVHVVSTESAAGSLRFGLPRPRMVIGYPDSLANGPILNLHTEVGLSYRIEWLYENINSEQEDHLFENQIMNTLREIEDIALDAPVYIWYGNNAMEQVGLRFFLYQLREKNNKIFLINSTEFNENAVEPVFYTSQMETDDLRVIFEKDKKPLTEKERAQYQKEWEQLSETKEVLRIWEDSQIKSVPEDYYDSFIIETLRNMHIQQDQKDFIKTGSLIGEILDSHIQIDIFFLEYRIRHLVYNGVFELKGIPKSMRHYRVKIR